MGDADLYSTTGPGAVSRRGFMKIGAAGTAGAVGLGAAGPHVPSATEEAEAVAPIVLAAAMGATAASGVTVGWAIGDYDPLGLKEPSDGLSGDALVDSAYQTSKTRASTNASTFIDNQNIIDSGVRHAAYGDGKVAAIEELNNESSKSVVKSAATGAVDDYETTIKKNFLKTWNESVRELSNNISAIANHADISANLFNFVPIDDSEGSSLYGTNFEFPTRTMTMPDGTDFELVTLLDSSNLDWDPAETRTEYWASGFKLQYDADAYSGYSDQYEMVTYLNSTDWRGIFNQMTQTFTNVRDNLLLWVDNVYSQVQAGELKTEDLLTARERANMSADEETLDQAIADLMALNISTNLEREATIKLDGGNITLQGQLATTGDTTISTGTVDPSADDYSYYLTYDISQGEGIWTDYNEGIDGGVVTFTSEPYEGTEFDIHTTASETATVSASAFSETDTGGEWTADVSNQLDTAITNIDSVNFYAETSETQYETVLLKDTFEVVTFTDTETGEEFEETEHTSPEAHDDTNYITQDEWDKMAERQQKLIEEYNEDSSGGGGGGILPDGGLGGSTGMLLLVLAGGAAVLGLQGDD